MSIIKLNNSINVNNYTKIGIRSFCTVFSLMNTNNSLYLSKGSRSYRLSLEFDLFPHTTSADSYYVKVGAEVSSSLCSLCSLSLELGKMLYSNPTANRCLGEKNILCKFKQLYIFLCKNTLNMHM